MQDFIQLILKNLKANGYPDKKVGLPIETMYEKADDRGLNFNQVLEVMKNEHQVGAEIETERVVFFSLEQTNPNQPNQEDMLRQAQEAMANMSPEQLQQMQQMFMNMSEDEKAEIMRKGKEMSLI
jgi:hypothetical protein